MKPTKSILTLALFFLTISNSIAQNIFIEPDLKGQLNDNTYDARSEALGKNTILLDGIKTAFENPATISSSNEKLSFAFNYDKGSSMFPKSYYLTGSLSYRINDRIAISVDTRSWIDPKPYWTTVIGNQAFQTNKRTLKVNSIMVAGKIIKGLHLGVSAHFLTQKEIDNKKTGSQFLMNTGLIYDKEVNWIKNEKISNQKIRGAISLFNTLMKPTYTERANGSVINFRDIPIILRVGTAYSLSHPINLEFAKNSKLLSDTPQKMDLALYLQYTDWLKTKEHLFTGYKHHTMVSAGLESTFLNTVAIRLGYFTETRGTEVDPSEIAVTKNRRKGFTWGLGFILPTHKWSDNKFPFEIKLDLLAKRLPDFLEERKTAIIHPDFTDKKMQLSIGLQFNLKK